jgi:uncharacterized protein
MKQQKVLHTLKNHKQALSAKYGVTRIGVFGSTARDQATDESDIDIIVEMPPDLFEMVHMKEELEQILAAPIDLIRYHKYLNSYFKSRIDNEAIFV